MKQLYPIRIRSALLSRMPQSSTNPWRRAGRISGRLVVWSGVAVAAVSLVVSVYTRMWPVTGIGWTLYSIHDTVYLWVKGNTFTRYLPASIIGWGFIATLISLVLASRLSDRSFVRRPHLRLVRRLVRRPHLHWILVGGARVFRRIGLKPYLIRAVADHERELAVLELSQQPLGKAGAGVCGRASHTTLLCARLGRYFNDDPHRLVALEQWAYAYLLIRSHGDPGAVWFPALIDDLAEAFRAINLPPAAPVTPRAGDDFEPYRLVADLGILLAIGRSQAGRPDSDPPAPPLAPQSAPQWLFDRYNDLIRSVDGRRQLLDWAYVAIQDEMLGDPSRVEMPEWLPRLSRVPGALAGVGRIGVGIALHLAVLKAQPHIALAYLESMDSLAFAVRAVSSPSPALESITNLVDVPELADTDVQALAHPAIAHRLLALLRQNAHEAQRRDWEAELGQPNGLVQAGDFEFEQLLAQDVDWLADGTPGQGEPK